MTDSDPKFGEPVGRDGFHFGLRDQSIDQILVRWPIEPRRECTAIPRMVGAESAVPEKDRRRNLYQHNAQMMLMRDASWLCRRQ